MIEGSLAAVLRRLDLSGLNGNRIFLTGGTGFFGLWLLSALRLLVQTQNTSFEVTVLSREPKDKQHKSPFLIEL